MLDVDSQSIYFMFRETNHLKRVKASNKTPTVVLLNIRALINRFNITVVTKTEKRLFIKIQRF